MDIELRKACVLFNFFFPGPSPVLICSGRYCVKHVSASHTSKCMYTRIYTYYLYLCIENKVICWRDKISTYIHILHMELF